MPIRILRAVVLRSWAPAGAGTSARARRAPPRAAPPAIRPGRSERNLRRSMLAVLGGAPRSSAPYRVIGINASNSQRLDHAGHVEEGERSARPRQPRHREIAEPRAL